VKENPGPDEHAGEDAGAPRIPRIPDHELLRRIGKGAYGEVWLARNALGTYRAVKIVRRDKFPDERPYEREFRGIQKFEPISRLHESQVDILQVGRNDAEGYFYYVMELADDSGPEGSDGDSARPHPGPLPRGEGDSGARPRPSPLPQGEEENITPYSLDPSIHQPANP
jgi:hypothetical protein